MDDRARAGDLSRPARDPVELQARAALHKRYDPFPNVPPALLSTCEIRDYDRETGMTGTVGGVRDGHLKAASVELFAGGRYIYWKGKKKIEKEIAETQTFIELPANSIVFVQTRNTIRLPEYIAMRFNLRITHVHRGLLLGTGPLVDPGFEGQLLIPLHNLTSSDYLLDTSKALIWAEFTKTSAHYEVRGGDGEFCQAPANAARVVSLLLPDKVNNTPDQYLYKAGGGLPIASSIPTAVRGARRDAKSAKEATERVQTWARGFGLLAVLGAVLGIAGIVNTTWNLVQSASMSARTAGEAAARLEAEVKAGAKVADQAREDALKATARIGELERTVSTDDVKHDLAEARAKIEELERGFAVATENIKVIERSPRPISVVVAPARPRQVQRRRLRPKPGRPPRLLRG